KGTPQPKVGDLAKLSDDELVDLLKHKNSWWWRKALLILQERGAKAAGPKLREMAAASEDYRHSLRALWALHNVGGLEEKFLGQVLRHPQPWVRAWAVRLAAQAAGAPPAGELHRLAENDPSPDVRLQLAAACQRLRGRLDTR